MNAFPVRGPGFIPQDDSFLHVATALASTNNVRDDHGQPEPRPAPILNEVFVKDPEIASSSIADQKAVEKAQCWPQRWRVLATVLVIGILVSIIAIVIKKLTEPGLSARPTLAPSASPSQSFFTAGTCGNGTSGDGNCPDPSLCCSRFGWCGTGEDYCGLAPPSDPTPTAGTCGNGAREIGRAHV